MRALAMTPTGTRCPGPRRRVAWKFAHRRWPGRRTNLRTGDAGKFGVDHPARQLGKARGRIDSPGELAQRDFERAWQRERLSGLGLADCKPASWTRRAPTKPAARGCAAAWRAGRAGTATRWWRPREVAASFGPRHGMHATRTELAPASALRIEGGAQATPASPRRPGRARRTYRLNARTWHRSHRGPRRSGNNTGAPPHTTASVHR